MMNIANEWIATASLGRVGGIMRMGWQIKRLALIAVALALGGSLVSVATAATLNVKNTPYNAVGNGSTDDTAAIRSAINAAGVGDTVYVPDGVYLINTLSPYLRLRSSMTFQMSSGAVLQAITNDSPTYYILLASGLRDVTVTGGTLRGDRAGHTPFSDPLNDEWGMGLMVTSCTNFTVTNVLAKECWGDGFTVTCNDISAPSSNITFINCVADHNRRQGMSVISVTGLTVTNCVFLNTIGTPPEAGIDIEPNPNQWVINSSITGCFFTNNAGGGILCGPLNNHIADSGVTNCIIENNTVISNGVGGYYPIRYGIELGSCQKNIVRNNFVDQQVGIGIAAIYTSGVIISNNMVTRTSKGGQAGLWAGVGIELGTTTNTVCTYNVNVSNEGLAVYDWGDNVNMSTNNNMVRTSLRPNPPSRLVSEGF